MFVIGECVIENEVAGASFACDVHACRGACCTLPGGRGAPLEDAEADEIARALPHARQFLTRASLSLSSAAIARVETLDLGDDEKNELCPAQTMFETPLDYLRMLVTGLTTEARWSAEPLLHDWISTSRVNITRDAVGDPAAAEVVGRLFEALGPAIARLAEYDAALV